MTPLSYSARGQEPWGHPDTCQARSRGAAPPGQKGAQSSVPAPTAGRPAQYHQEAGVPGGPLPLSPPAPSPSQWRREVTPQAARWQTVVRRVWEN